jgi:hypothetical protein
MDAINYGKLKDTDENSPEGKAAKLLQETLIKVMPEDSTFCMIMLPEVRADEQEDGIRFSGKPLVIGRGNEAAMAGAMLAVATSMMDRLERKPTMNLIDESE